MAKFDLIEGGNKPRNYQVEMAKQALAALAIEVVRALSRSNTNESKFYDALIDFIEKIREVEADQYSDVFASFNDMREAALGHGTPGSPISDDTKRIVWDSLSLAVDLFSDDNFARARASKLNDALTQSIEAVIVEHERRSRKNGWSYVAEITHNLPPIERKIAPSRNKRKSKPKK